MFIADIASGLRARRYGARGPNFTTVSACASGAHAVGTAYRLIARGEADVMIAGGAEATVTPMTMAGFASMRALSTRNDPPETASRPFEGERDGRGLGAGTGWDDHETFENAAARAAKSHEG